MNKRYLRSFTNGLSTTTAYPILLTQLLHVNQGFWILAPAQGSHSFLSLGHLRLFPYPTPACHSIHLFIHSVIDPLIAYCDPSKVLNAGDTEVSKTDQSFLSLAILASGCIWAPASLCTWLRGLLSPFECYKFITSWRKFKSLCGLVGCYPVLNRVLLRLS